MPKSCPKAKTKIFINWLFYLQPIVDFSNIKTLSNYLFSYHIRNITIHKIYSTILRSIFKKAPSENDIPNLILKLLIDFLLSHLYQIFNKCLNIRFCLIHFRSSIIVVFCKLEKLNYITAKSYPLLFHSTHLKKLLNLFLLKKLYIWSKLMNCCLLIILMLCKLDLPNMPFTI